ncbi:hypothetical protein FB451DRAFT_1141519 [Mycena latifolia]|nr:hypothetical protein FB451DRAFT_1141519 [Mycena latifolia]
MPVVPAAGTGDLESKSTDSPASSDGWWDEWPKDFDGTGLLNKIENGEPLFRFSVQDVFSEVEKNLRCRVIGVPHVGKGSNYFGIHIQTDNGKDVLVRVRRSDVNWPKYHDHGWPIAQLVVEIEFEAATYQLLRANREILASNLLYYRGPTQVQRSDKDLAEIPKDLVGRPIFVFEKAEGVKNVWPDNRDKRLAILSQSARIRAALFRFDVPLDFAKLWLPRCPPNPKVLPGDVEPTRNFAIHFLVSKVEETIKNEGDVIGWEPDHNVVGPMAVRAKQSLLRLIPHVFPVEEEHCDLYRLVLEHGDFGIHNMTITDSDPPTVTSLYDWETGHIVPALLSDPQMVTEVDLEINGDGCPVLSRLMDDPSDEHVAEYKGYAKHYFQVLNERTVEYIPAIKAGKDARHIWFTFKAWTDEEPEEYFGQLGSWADCRWKELVE